MVVRGAVNGEPKLLGIKPVGAFLRRVPPDGQRTRQRFGLEAVAETGHIAGCNTGAGGIEPLRPGFWTFMACPLLSREVVTSETNLLR